jgi:hypothetical protein
MIPSPSSNTGRNNERNDKQIAPNLIFSVYAIQITFLVLDLCWFIPSTPLNNIEQMVCIGMQAKLLNFISDFLREKICIKINYIIKCLNQIISENKPYNLRLFP